MHFIWWGHLMRKISFILILAFLTALFVIPVCYAEGTDDAGGKFDGYIVKLSTSDGVRLMSNDGLEAIKASENLYLAAEAKDVIELTQAGVVEYLEPNYTVTLMDVPNDRLYSQQWNLEYINASASWDNGYNGSGVRIAIIDSGLNISHEDLAGVSILTGKNVLDNSTNVEDILGHGTFVSGVIAAKRNNSIGISGITDGVTLVPIKCFSDSKETSVSYIIRGIYYAIDEYNCSVINLSLGLDRDMTSLKECIDYADNKGVIIVSAAGNTGGTEKLYPAAYDNVIGVGSVSKAGTVSGFSNHNSSVCVVAPGEGIISLGKDKSGYSEGSGTSFSVPHVSAMAVIAKCIDPGITVPEFKAMLIACADDLGTPGYDEYYGYGSVDIVNLITVLTDVTPPNTGFTDIAGHWAEDYINYVTEKNLFNGMSDTLFCPELNMSRAMIVTVLSRLHGADISSMSSGFSDVPNGEWYSSAVAWGAKNGIVLGYENGLFKPNDDVSREQMAVFLYRYAVNFGLSYGTASVSSLNKFSDAGSVSAWAKDAIAWCIENGIITGRTTSTIVPQGNTTRAEVATIISRFCEKFL